MSEIGILGAGGMARETARYLVEPTAFFAVNKEFLDDTQPVLIDIEQPTDEQRLTKVVAALGAPAVRKAMVELWPGDAYSNVIAESAEVYTENIGKGLIIAPKSVITTDTVIGNHTIINIGATVSHDCELGEYVTVSPGAHVAGNVKLENGVFIGIGATISNGVRIAEGTVVGAGAVVISDIATPNSVVVGNPAKLLRVQEGWLKHV